MRIIGKNYCWKTIIMEDMYRPMRASRDQSSSFPDRDESRSLDHRNDQSLILVLVGIHY